jgi:NADH:ubiquinone oxidoreductase subunit F (NADH-binding)
VSLTFRDHAKTAPKGGRRLLHAPSGLASARGLEMHLDLWGDLRLRESRLIDELEEAGLVGRGGASFPVSTKWKSVGGASRRRPVVVANGAESEPASRKDALLLSHAPHLVLDGLALAAGALHAQQAIVYVPVASIPVVEAAIAERRGCRLDPISIEIAESPDAFLAGQESAVVNALGGRRRAVPSFVGLTSIRERGVGGRPTLVQNVETLANVALIARFGATWFRQVGTPENPGTMLLTVNGHDGPVIVEAVLGSSLREATGISADELARSRGVLLGGYGGGWVSPKIFGELAVSEKAARGAGATLGAGVVALLPEDVCPLAEMADVVRYMEGEGAGQCGPCVHGLAELADALERLAFGRAGGPGTDRVLEICNLVDGRGACRHPDGVARFVRSGLGVFADEAASHQRRGHCSQTRAMRVLPAAKIVRRRLVSRS